MIKEADIVYEKGEYWILKTPISFEVYRNGITHSTRCAIIGLSLGLDRAIKELERRITT